MDILTHKAMLQFRKQLAELLNEYGEVALSHTDNDVVHHVMPGTKGWLVITRSGLGELRHVEYLSLDLLAFDLVGTQIGVPAERCRYAAG